MGVDGVADRSWALLEVDTISACRLPAFLFSYRCLLMQPLLTNPPGGATSVSLSGCL